MQENRFVVYGKAMDKVGGGSTSRAFQSSTLEDETPLGSQFVSELRVESFDNSVK